MRLKKFAGQQIFGSEATSESQSVSPFSTIFPIIVLLGLTLIMFGDVLFGPKSVVLSYSGLDLSLFFGYWREFGFNQLRQGHLALWNPHIFSGVPYLGEFQSALFYPINIIYLIFPISRAINWDITIHTFLVGYFTYLWNVHRMGHVLSSLLAAILLMFSGAFFLHIFPGHLNHLAGMAWVPLIFLSIDGFVESKMWKWCFLGIFSISMQILAGFPQHVFYTAIAAIIYYGLVISKTGWKLKFLIGFFIIYLGASALSAVQLLVGFDVAGESARSGGVSYDFASMFSFPPENFITLLAPGFFGNNYTMNYWGRWYCWEMIFFVSVTGLILAVYGAVFSSRESHRFSTTMLGILLILAMGKYTPIYKILFNWFPGYNLLRGSSKFLFVATLFLTNLSGSGLHHLFQRKQVEKKVIIAVVILSILIGMSGLVLRILMTYPSINFWPKVMHAITLTKETYLEPMAYVNVNFLERTEMNASNGLLISAGICLLVAVLFYCVKYSIKTIYLIFLLALVEIFSFARGIRPSFDYNSTRLLAIKNYLSMHPGDYRILNQLNPNSAIVTGGQDLWGYAPSVSRRYAEFMTYTQGYNPDYAMEYLTLTRIPPIYKMLRFRFLFSTDTSSAHAIEIKGVMPRCVLIRQYQVIPYRNKIFAAMDNPAFDPQQEVILERTPNPAPEGSNEMGTVKITDTTTDSLTVEADLPSPAILLITDSYSKGWRASAFPDSVQKKYELMPANYILRAIPLEGGHHHIQIEYLPLAFQVGKWISIFSLIVYFSLLGWYIKKAN